MSDFDPICATCGKPRSNHPYRHQFKGPSKDDTIEALTARLAEVEAERDDAYEGLTAAYLAGAHDEKARERDAFDRGFAAALEKCYIVLGGAKPDAIPLPDTKGDDT